MHKTRDSINDIWGPRTPYYNEWPIRVDEQTSDSPDQWIPILSLGTTFPSLHDSELVLCRLVAPGKLFFFVPSEISPRNVC